MYQNVPCGHHVQFKVNVMEDVILQRSYTPVIETIDKTDAISDRCLHFLIKTYPDGAVTQYLNKLKVGSTILVSDTQGTFDRSILQHIRHLVVVYAGTGFTPMVKVIKEFLMYAENSTNQSTLTILSFNKSVKDVIWMEHLKSLEISTCERKNVSVNIHYVLSQEVCQKQGYHYGRVSTDLLKELLKERLQKISDPVTLHVNSRLCCICGPIPFNREAKHIFETTFDYKTEEIHVFEG